MPSRRISKSQSFRILAVISAVMVSSIVCNISRESQPDDGDLNILTPVDSNTPVLDSTTEPTQPPNFSYEGISYSFDESIATHVNVEIMPAVSEGDAPPWGVAPEHYKFTFVDYVLSDTFHQARVLIFPVTEFEAINPMVVNDIAALKDVLNSRTAEPSEKLPFLPFWNAAALIQTNMEYLDFSDGSGLRYLAQYGQAAWPINNQDLFYTFQGLTSDGRYYISAVLPISNPVLPDIGEYEDFGSAFQDYISETKILLAAQPASSFVPNLALLDALFQSLRIE